MTTLQAEASVPRGPGQAKVFALPMLVGILAALAMLGLYLGLLSVLQSFAHALEQLSTDRLWVGLVATGFGAQVGLYTYLRAISHAAKAASATAMTGAGTGTSTIGMLACCAHHITDIAPLLGLTGAAGLSGAVTFLAEYKIPFIVFGLLVNVAGIVVTVRTIRKEHARLAVLREARAVAPDGEELEEDDQRAGCQNPGRG